MQTALGNIGASLSANGAAEYDAVIAQDPAAVERFIEQEAVLANCTLQLNTLGTAPPELTDVENELKEACKGLETAAEKMRGAIFQSSYTAMAAALNKLSVPIRQLRDAETALS